jgi:hypothetical protein
MMDQENPWEPFAVDWSRRQLEMGREGGRLFFLPLPDRLLQLLASGSPLLPVGAQEQKPCIFTGVRNYNADGACLERLGNFSGLSVASYIFFGRILQNFR